MDESRTSRQIEKAKKACNATLAEYCRDYFDQVPMRTLFTGLELFGFQLAQGGWAELLCGSTGRAKTKLVETADGAALDFLFVLTWSRRASGKYEIVAYLS